MNNVGSKRRVALHQKLISSDLLTRAHPSGKSSEVLSISSEGTTR
jgi:hypothetical protein